MKKKNTPIQATHIAFHNCNQFVFLERKKKSKRKASGGQGFIWSW